MGYLICEKCGGYYKLQEGESLDDFESCECGGKLNYTDSFNEDLVSEEPVSDKGDKSGKLITKYCTNCGYGNDMDATSCDSCGAKLERDSQLGKGEPTKEPEKPPQKEGMKSSTKWLIAVVVILLGVFVVTAGALMMNQGTTTAPNNTQVSVNDSQEKVTQAKWHEVTSYSGIGDNYRSFSIKGDRFKVVMNATPTMNYNTNFMNVDISDASRIIGSGKINWGPTSAVTSKEKTIKITAAPGTYHADVNTKDLKRWTVTIYDYY